MNPLKILSKLLQSLPAEPRVQRLCASLWPLRPKAEVQGQHIHVAVQCVQDGHYLALFAHIVHALRQRLPITAALVVPRSFDAAIGVGWRQTLLRAFPLGQLQAAQWVRAYAVVGGRVAYASHSLRHPVGDLLDLWRSWRVWHGLDDIDALERLHVDGVHVGDLVIDSFLRFRPSPRMVVDDPFTWLVLWQAHRDLRRARRYFRAARPALYLCSYATYVQHGVAARVALQEGVQVLSFGNFQEFGKRLSLKDPFHTRHPLGYRRAFAKLADPVPLLEEARRQLDARLSGGIDSATSYMAASAYRKTTDEVPDVRGAVIVFLHDFYDSPHVYADMLFPDFWTWICSTIETLRSAGIPFFLKPHPNQIALSDGAIDQLRRSFPELRFVPSGVTNRQLVDAGMACAVTVYGTVAHEMAYMGVPSIACASHPHVAFDFCQTARSRQEYADLLRMSLRLQPETLAYRDQVLRFYTMHNLSLPEMQRQLRDALIAAWKQSHDAGVDGAAQAQAYAHMAGLPGFSQFIDDLVASLAPLPEEHLQPLTEGTR